MVYSPSLETDTAALVSRRLVSVLGVFRNTTVGTHTLAPDTELSSDNGSWGYMVIVVLQSTDKHLNIKLYIPL